MRALTMFESKRWSATLLSFLLVIPLSIIFQGQKQTIDAANSEYKLVGYYTSWAPPANLDPNKLTHINFAFADVCWDGEHGNPEVWAPEGESSTWPCTDLQGNETEIPNGSVVLGEPDGDFKALQKLRELKEINPNLKTLVSIGGWSWSYNISLAARTEETRKIFAQSAVEYIREFDMDGVDLDWEYPVEGGMWNNHRDPSDKQNHTLLLQEIRNALNEAEVEDGKEYLLTIASSVSFTYTENNELDKISEIVDFINIMTYDFNGTWAPMSAHNAPLYEDGRAMDAGVHPYHIDQAIEGHLQAGVPKNKLVMGLPFYGRSWGNCNEENNGEMTTINGGYQLCDGNGGGDLEPGVYSYDYIRAELINKNDYKYYWNNIAKVPYLYNDENGEFITFDNVESIGYKTSYIKEKGLAGGMIWELNQDDKDFNLLKTASSNLGISSEVPIDEPEAPIEDPENPNNDENIEDGDEDDDTGEDENIEDGNEDNDTGEDENIEDGNENNDTGEDENIEDGNENNDTGEEENIEEGNEDNDTGEDENIEEGNEDDDTDEDENIEEGNEDNDTVEDEKVEDGNEDNDTVEDENIEDGNEDNDTGEDENIEDGNEDSDTGEDEKIEEGNEDNDTGEDEKIEDGDEDNDTGEDENIEDGNEDDDTGEDENIEDGNEDNDTGEDENIEDSNEDNDTGNAEDNKDDNKDNGSGTGVDKGDIEDINEGSKAEGKLPSTASNMFNKLVVGTIVILIGVGIFYMQRMRQDKKE